MFPLSHSSRGMKHHNNTFIVPEDADIREKN